MKVGEHSPSGIPVERVYRPPPANNARDSIEDPGEFPFTRGIHPEMYRRKLWTMRQYAGFGTARRGCPSPSISQPRWDMTLITRVPGRR